MTVEKKSVVTSLTQIGWPGGVLTLRYVGIPKVTEEAAREIKDIMQQFSTDCQKMLIWFAGILGSREAIKSHLDKLTAQGKPLSVNTYRPNGRVDSVLASLPVEDVVEAVSADGEFERLYAKAFVIFTYQIWDEVARTRIAKALKVEKPNHVTSDLMGDWRHLRNWLIHRTETTEKDFFEKSKTLPRLLDMPRGEPSLTAGMVAVLMRQLNNMQVDVNPGGLEFGLELTPIDPAMLAQVANSVEPGTGIALPEALMLPSPAIIVFSDEISATIHERDCSQCNAQLQSLERGRQMVVHSVALAREVVKHMGKHEALCEHCSPRGPA